MPHIKKWIKKDQKFQKPLYTKFNISLKLPIYTIDDYLDDIKLLDADWNQEETDKLWELL